MKYEDKEKSNRDKKTKRCHIKGTADEQDERTYCCLSSDMGTAYYLRPSQWLLPLGSLPQGDQGRHVCGRTDQAAVNGT